MARTARRPRRKSRLPDSREVTVTLTRDEWISIGVWLKRYRSDDFSHRVRDVLRAAIEGHDVPGVTHLPDGRISLTRPLDSFRLMCSRLLPNSVSLQAAAGLDPLYRQVLACNWVGESGGDLLDEDEQ